jgi:hypothetical protein
LVRRQPAVDGIDAEGEQLVVRLVERRSLDRAATDQVPVEDLDVSR